MNAWVLAVHLPDIAESADDPFVRELAKRSHENYLYPVDAQVFSPEGELLLPIGGTGRDIGAFYLPAGVWTDGNGRVYVADMFNGRIVVLEEMTGLEATG